MDYGNLFLTSTKTKIKPKSTQGKFQGSTRQFRGKIIKHLTSHLTATKEMIIKECAIPVELAD